MDFKDEQLSVAERSRLQRGMQNSNNSGALVELCTSDVSYDATLWFKIFPNFVRISFDKCPFTITIGRDLICNRILQMYKVIVPLSEPSRGPYYGSDPSSARLMGQNTDHPAGSSDRAVEAIFGVCLLDHGRSGCSLGSIASEWPAWTKRFQVSRRQTGHRPHSIQVLDRSPSPPISFCQGCRGVRDGFYQHPHLPYPTRGASRSGSPLQRRSRSSGSTRGATVDRDVYQSWTFCARKSPTSIS